MSLSDEDLKKIGQLIKDEVSEISKSMDEKLKSLKSELQGDISSLKNEMGYIRSNMEDMRGEMYTLKLQVQQVANNPSSYDSYAEGLSTAAAIGGTPSRFNPSYLR